MYLGFVVNALNLSEAAANPFNFCVDVRIGVQRASSQEGQTSPTHIAPSSFCQCQCYNSNILVNSMTSHPPHIRSIPILMANNHTTLMHYPHKTRNSHHNAEPSLRIQPRLLLHVNDSLFLQYRKPPELLPDSNDKRA